MTLRTCLEPGCPAPVARGRCTRHRHEHERKRPTAARRGYRSLKHLTWRRTVIRRDGNCVDCGKMLVDHQGEPLWFAHADHIVPVSAGGTWALSNGAARCDRCHGRKTRRDQRKEAHHHHEEIRR